MRLSGGSWAWICWCALSPMWAAESGRQWPESFHEDANLFDVCFVDPRQGWAVGDRGTILHTQDGGETWSLQPSPVTCRLESVQFLDARQGWAAGGYTAAYTHRAVGVLLKTENGGQTWKQIERQFLPWLTQVQFLDPQRGFLLGLPSSMFPGAAFQTRDGGQHWTPWPGQSSGWIYGQFPPQGSGLLLDRHGKLFAAEPAEIRPLAAAPTDPRLPLRIRLDAAQHGLLCGNQGLVYSTDNGGRSWQVPRKLPMRGDWPNLTGWRWMERIVTTGSWVYPVLACCTHPMVASRGSCSTRGMRCRCMAWSSWTPTAAGPWERWEPCWPRRMEVTPGRANAARAVVWLR